MLVFRGYAMGRVWNPGFVSVTDDNPGMGSIGVCYSRDQVPKDMYFDARYTMTTGISLSGGPNTFYYSNDPKLLERYKIAFNTYWGIGCSGNYYKCKC